MSTLFVPRQALGAQAAPRFAARPPALPSAAGFTMVEIALCIAIVAFAMVAIIGVLPTGLKVQRENREDTIINQEGSFWLEALRGGAQGLDYLTNHVDLIFVDTLTKLRGEDAQRPRTNYYRYYRFSPDNRGFQNGHDIIGLLSIPRVFDSMDDPEPRDRLMVRSTNTTAYVRALTGSAVDQTPTNEFAFTYRLKPEIRPYEALTGVNTDLRGLAPADWVARSNMMLHAGALRMNLYELRLTIDWPVYNRRGRLEVGGNRKVFRTLVGGSMATNRYPFDNRYLFFLKPSEFASPK